MKKGTSIAPKGKTEQSIVQNEIIFEQLTDFATLIKSR